MSDRGYAQFQHRHAQISTMGQHAAPPIVHEVLRSPGQPLDAATRAFMESRFGHDFSQVRVHSNAAAEQSARAVNALAYTVGRDIVFNAGRYAPKTSAGQRLLAHELTHVVQQRNVAPGLAHSAALQMDTGEDAFEREAKSVADSLTSSERLQVSRMNQREGRISRQPDEEGLHTPAHSNSGGLLPYREAMEELDRKLYEEYTRNCAGIRILERLERKAISPSERVQGLERRIQTIPLLFQKMRSIEHESDRAQREKHMQDFREHQVTGEFPRFPEGYALRSEEAELATARCELSKARWELVRPSKLRFGGKD